MSRRPVLPPTYFLIGIVGVVVLHFVFPLSQLVGSPWRFFGVIPVIAGGLLSIHGSRLFDRQGTTVKPFEESAVLVVDGAYRYTRNPMYLGMVLILAGEALLLGSITPWIVPIVFVPILTRRFILREEASLERTFGDEYRAYLKSVNRWI